MKISTRQLKRIIREEYTLLKKQGFINESSFHGYRPGRVSRYKMQMPNSYIKKDIILILQTEGPRNSDKLFRSFSDASSREEFDEAVNDLLKSGSIFYDGFDKLKINPARNNQ